MLKKYSFIPVLLGVFLGLAWLSFESTHTSVPAPGEDRLSKTQWRSELIEVLDQVVVYQNYYHSVFGSYTRFISRTGFRLPPSLLERYDIRIEVSTSDRLLVTALARNQMHGGDVVSIDHDYQLHANFEVPEPRLDYLKLRAFKHLRNLKNATQGQTVTEESVFKGYFQYSVRAVGLDSLPFADGVRAPAIGVHLELSADTDSAANTVLVPGDSTVSPFLSGFSSSFPRATQESERPNLEQEVSLAQRIFVGEVGRQARTWAELSDTARFFPGAAIAPHEKSLESSAAGLNSSLTLSRSVAGREISSSVSHPSVSVETGKIPLDIEFVSVEKSHKK